MSETEIYQSFDASVWAREFCDIFEKNHGFRPDEGWMLTWFASALMRGYDEACWKQEREDRANGATAFEQTTESANADPA